MLPKINILHSRLFGSIFLMAHNFIPGYYFFFIGLTRTKYRAVFLSRCVHVTEFSSSLQQLDRSLLKFQIKFYAKFVLILTNYQIWHFKTINYLSSYFWPKYLKIIKYKYHLLMTKYIPEIKRNMYSNILWWL